MSRHDGLSQWHTTVSTHLPHLSRAHAYGLAVWSYGMVLAQSCGITSVDMRPINWSSLSVREPAVVPVLQAKLF